MGIHDGHRERLKNRFLKSGLDDFPEHNALELLLFFSIPQKDTNPLAHKLIERFGSLAAAMDAPYEQLLQVEGVGANTATLLKLIPQMCRKYLTSKNENRRTIKSAADIAEYMADRFYGTTKEELYMLSFDPAGRLMDCSKINTGAPDSVEVDIMMIVEKAVTIGSRSVVLVHNHLSSLAAPSTEDIAVSQSLMRRLSGVSIKLLDHIIVAEQNFVSLAEIGALDIL